MKKYLLFFFVLVLVSNVALGQTADQLLVKAKSEAKAEGKNILLIFHASWCGWCKKFEKGLDSSLVKPFFDDNYVRVHITVKESAQNKDLETVGGDKYLKQFGGADSGLPYWVILNDEGELIASSVVEGGNLGCPASEEEVDAFIGVLKKTTKNASVNERLIKEVFVIKK